MTADALPGLPAFRAVLSPCTGACRAHDDGGCEGCALSPAEVARWPDMSDDERLHLVVHVLPARRHARHNT